MDLGANAESRGSVLFLFADACSGAGIGAGGYEWRSLTLAER
jgi:hypothetical protein